MRARDEMAVAVPSCGSCFERDRWCGGGSAVRVRMMGSQLGTMIVVGYHDGESGTLVMVWI